VDQTPEPDLEVTVIREPGATVIAVAGELDAATTPDLHEPLTRAAGDAGALVLDLVACEFVDSTGLHAIIQAHGTVEDRGGRFALACVEGGPVARVIEVALPGMLELHASREAALRAVAA